MPPRELGALLCDLGEKLQSFDTARTEAIICGATTIDERLYGAQLQKEVCALAYQIRQDVPVAGKALADYMQQIRQAQISQIADLDRVAEMLEAVAA